MLKFYDVNFTNRSIFYSFEVVDSGGETKLQVTENLNL